MGETPMRIGENPDVKILTLGYHFDTFAFSSPRDAVRLTQRVTPALPRPRALARAIFRVFAPSGGKEGRVSYDLSYKKSKLKKKK